MGERRDKDGRFTPEHTDAEILAAVRTHEPAATSEVAGEVDITRQGADRRLRRLRDEGKVNSKKIGASLVWFAPDSRERREEPVEDTPDRSDTSDPATVENHSTPDDRDAPVGIADAVERVAEEWNDTPDRLEARKDAARAVLEYAEEHGTVSKQEAKEEVYPKHAVEGQNARTWYRKNVRPVLNEVAEYDQSARAYRLTVEGT